jgi:hypothetical protein
MVQGEAADQAPAELDEVAAEEAGSEKVLPAASPVQRRRRALQPHREAIGDPGE